MNMRGFNIELALKVGVKTALVYNYLAVSLQNPNGDFCYDQCNRKYCDVKVHEIKHWLPFMSENRIRRCLNKLCMKRIINLIVIDHSDDNKPSEYSFCICKEYETIMM